MQDTGNVFEERSAITVILAPYCEVFNCDKREDLDDAGLEEFAAALPELLRSICRAPRTI